MADIGGNTVPRITKAEHIGEDTGDNIGAKRVVPFDFDGATLTYYRSGLGRTERYDYDDPNTIYVGTAAIGTSDSSVGWSVTKYDLTDSNNASGKVATDVSWDDRASGSFA